MFKTICSLLVFIGFSIGGDHSWCGKVYKPGFPATDPGGAILPPSSSPFTMLDFKAQPRFNLYVEGDTAASLLISASLSRTHGKPYHVDTERSIGLSHKVNNVSDIDTEDHLLVEIYAQNTPSSWRILSKGMVAIGPDQAELAFSTASLVPRQTPLTIEARGRSMVTNQTFNASTHLSYLPSPRDEGSIVRIDNKHGSLQVRRSSNLPNAALKDLSQNVLAQVDWTTIFPFSFYISGPWLDEHYDNMRRFVSQGYNILHIIPDIGEGYDWPQLSRWLDEAERLNLWIMFDMRWQYQDPEWISRVIPRMARRKNLLLWYTTDEPDGHEDPLNATQKAYHQIKALDPFHPVSLCLNCENYHFEEYASGADILLSDTYPIGANTTFSPVWNTACNSTYGCCGCDNCYGNDDITNIASRLDTWHGFQDQLGWSRKKPIWTVPQAFGPELHWRRRPSPREEVAMTVLAVNHGAKGSVAWVWPTPGEYVRPTSSLAKIFTTPQITGYILGADRFQGLHVEGTKDLDVAAWIIPKQGVFISIVNTAHDAITGKVTITLPKTGSKVGDLKGWWGGGWQVNTSQQDDRIVLEKKGGVEGMDVDLIELHLVP